MSCNIQSQNNLIKVSEIVNNNHPETAITLENNPHSSLHMQKLQDRMNQLEKAVLGLGKKESYVAAMAVDLEHIMMILIKRLDREGGQYQTLGSS